MNEEVIHFDEFGNAYTLDERNIRKPLMQLPEVSKDSDSDFRTYDTSEGHCGLCGRLSCNGGCFK